MADKVGQSSGASAAVREVLGRAKAEGRNALTAPEGKLVCDAYGIPVPQEGVANSAQEARTLAEGMGYRLTEGESDGGLTEVIVRSGRARPKLTLVHSRPESGQHVA